MHFYKKNDTYVLLVLNGTIKEDVNDVFESVLKDKMTQAKLYG